jgi:hypothetical protein
LAVARRAAEIGSRGYLDIHVACREPEQPKFTEVIRLCGGAGRHQPRARRRRRTARRERPAPGHDIRVRDRFPVFVEHVADDRATTLDNDVQIRLLLAGFQRGLRHIWPEHRSESGFLHADAIAARAHRFESIPTVLIRGRD